MNGNDAVLALIGIFDELEVSYMIVGSYSSNLYGVPRATKDADLVFHFESTDLSEIAKRLPEGVRFDEQSSFEMVTATRREILLLEGSNFKIELFHLSDDDFDQVRFKNRVVVQLDEETWVWAPRAPGLDPVRITRCGGTRLELSGYSAAKATRRDARATTAPTAC